MIGNLIIGAGILGLAIKAFFDLRRRATERKDEFNDYP